MVASQTTKDFPEWSWLWVGMFFFSILFSNENYDILMSRKHVRDPGMNIILFFWTSEEKELYLPGWFMKEKKKKALYIAASGAGNIRISSMQMDSPSDRVIWEGDKLSRVISKLHFREYCW